jgi:hypothetical protein
MPDDHALLEQGMLMFEALARSLHTASSSREGRKRATMPRASKKRRS